MSHVPSYECDVFETDIHGSQQNDEFEEKGKEFIDTNDNTKKAGQSLATKALSMDKSKSNRDRNTDDFSPATGTMTGKKS